MCAAYEAAIDETTTKNPCMKQTKSFTAALLVSGGAIAAVAVGFMAWRSLSAQPAILPLAERKQKLAQTEALFLKKFPNVPSITAERAAQLLQQQPDKYVLVDCRNKDEQQVSMLPGSRVVTSQDFEQQREAFNDTTAICYCTVGYRSGLFAQDLIEQGMQSANLQGGILAWTQAGLPLVDGSSKQQQQQQQTNKVHTYAARWAFHGDGYEPVYYKSEYVRMIQDQIGKLKKRVFGS